MTHFEPAQINVIVTTALHLLSTYLQPATEGAVKKVGEEFGKSVFEKIKNKFQHHPEATAALALVQKEPESKTALDVLKPHIEAAMKEDNDFAIQLQSFTNNYQQTNNNQQKNSGTTLNTAFYGNVEYVGNIGEVAGDVNFGKKPRNKI